MDNELKELESNLVTRVKPDKIINFLVEYLRANGGKIDVLELMARMNLWSKDTIRICRYMVECGIARANRHSIILKNRMKGTNISDDFTWLMKPNFNYRAKHNFNRTEQMLLDKFKSVLKGRPKNDNNLDQYYSTPETNIKRLKLALKENNCKDKSVCIMGDDDLTSLIFAMSGRFKSVVVFDVDERILSFLKKMKKKLNLKNFDIFFQDYQKPFSGEKKFDIFFSDPPATIEAVELVLGRATEVSNPGAVFFLSWSEFLWDPTYKSLINDVFDKSGWIKTEKMHEFNEYENECLIGYLTESDKITLKLFGITLEDIVSSPPIQRYGITRLLLKKGTINKLGNWGKNIYLDNSNVKKIKEESNANRESMIITQLNVDCYGCKGPLNNGKELISIMNNAAESIGAGIMGSKFQSYPVQGVTAIVFLAESHILITTYPEFGYATVEIFLCNKEMNPNKCWHVIESFLKPEKIVRNLWDHHIGRKYE